ncbi:hypothetical protein [Myxococcus stipitatus]|uniref:hypothetical protein n=1 Tax=Myxococcus stipitatus TaxID=83455 RepID=UPI0030CCE32A
MALRPAVPRLTAALLPERTARTGRRVLETRFAVTRRPAFLAATRFAATRLAPLRAVFLAATRDLGLRLADFALLFFSPPPVSLFTVAQARASDVFSDVPRPS